MTALAWGRHYLMCAPDYFDVLYEINPWMNREVEAGGELALEQWESLVATLVHAGAKVDLLQPEPGLPDLVFTANAGIVTGKEFIPSNFRYTERQGETAHDIAWFSQTGYEIRPLPTAMFNEGAGDSLPFNDVLLAGYGFRSDRESHKTVEQLTGTRVLSVQLVDPRLYHFDLTFAPLDQRHAIVAPSGWDEAGARLIESVVPEPLVLDSDEALSFCANSVVVNNVVIMPDCPPRVGRQLEQWGFDVVVSPVTEFIKGGGGCRCLTLALDVRLGSARKAIE